MNNQKITKVQYDHGESTIHIKAKDKISRILLNQDISLINHLGKKITIETNSISKIQQEFTWYQGSRSKPIKSFSADVTLLDKNNNLIAIIEVVKTNGISRKKYNFYQSLNVFWLELSAEHVLTEDSCFISSFKYNNFQESYIEPSLYFTQDKITKPNISKEQQRIILKQQIKSLSHKLKHLNLGAKRNFGIFISESDLNEGKRLRTQINKLTNKLKKLNLSKRQKRLRNKQIIKSKRIKEYNKKIIQKNSKGEKTRPKTIPNKKIQNKIRLFLENSKRTHNTKIPISDAIEYAKRFLMDDESFHLNKSLVRFLEKHKWKIKDDHFIFSE